MPTRKIMQVVKIRRTGNSNAISLPRDFEDLGYVAGAIVVVTAMPSGELRVLPQERMLSSFDEPGGSRDGEGLGHIPEVSSEPNSPHGPTTPRPGVPLAAR